MSINYREPDYDDTRCATCGAELHEQPAPMTWHDQGFCNLACAAGYPSGLILQGRPAVELAQLDRNHGGPGFEAEPIVEWLDGARPNAPIFLDRTPALLDGSRADWPAVPEAWAWELRSGGECRGRRVTPKPESLHHSGRRCRDCEDDRGDWEYHARLDD